MSAKVLVIASSKGREYRLDRAAAKRKVARGGFQWRDNFTIVEVPLFDGFLGTGNALPFSRTQNRLLAPRKLHYQIPATGAHERSMRCALINAVGGQSDYKEVAETDQSGIAANCFRVDRKRSPHLCESIANPSSLV